MSEQPICSVCGKKVWKMVTSYDNQGKIEVNIKDVCDCKPVLIPDFSNREPNLISTRKKNEAGKCCFHHCDNQLPREEYHYMGFLACEECGKKLQAEMKKMQEDSFAESMQRVMSVLEPDKK